VICKINEFVFMDINVLVVIVALLLVAVVSFVLGKKMSGEGGLVERNRALGEINDELQNRVARLEQTLDGRTEEVKRLTSERDVYRANVENLKQQMESLKSMSEQLRLEAQQKCENDIKRLAETYEVQLNQVRDASLKQIEALKEMNKKQVEDQLTLIREQMKSTSETVLKERQNELGSKNVEQVSKIVEPLQQSLNLMREALNDSKEKHQEALHKLDATIQANMKNSADLGETAARLTRALTGEVKVQGDFGELKLRQLLEDLGLRDGEQFSSQVHLRDKAGKLIKDDEGKGLIPDFVLHFPNHRDVVVDSKMSFTAYDRYVNAADPEEQTRWLKEHIASVRAQVERLAKKDYSKYIKEGYNKLNFVIMYIHTEGALNLALMNDGRLWKEAYDKGVLILGPQTMYMNLRILEMMWTQVRQLNNQEDMIKAASQIIDRTQDFAMRFAEVESKMRSTVDVMEKLKITTSNSGASIITAAKNLIKAGGRENKKKKGLEELDGGLFIESAE